LGEQEELNQKMMTLATKCMIHTRLKAIPSSIIAASIAYYARQVAHVSPVWTSVMTSEMFHDPSRDALGVRALQIICAMEEDAATWEELLLMKDSNSKIPARGKRNADQSCPIDGFGENDENLFDGEYEVLDLCDKLESIMADISSPSDGKIKSMSKDGPKKSPSSIAGLEA
jgi:hypothetical protein